MTSLFTSSTSSLLSSSSICSSCNSEDSFEYDNVGGTFTYVCRVCGHVQDENIITDKIEFSKSDSGATMQGQNYSYRDTQLGGYLMGGSHSNRGGGGGEVFGFRKNVISEAIRNDPTSNAAQRQSKARSQTNDRINKICYALKMPDYSTEQVKYLVDQMIRNYNAKMIEKYQLLNHSDGAKNNNGNGHVQSTLSSSYQGGTGTGAGGENEDYGEYDYYDEEYGYYDENGEYEYSESDVNGGGESHSTSENHAASEEEAKRKRKKVPSTVLTKRKLLSYTQTKRMQYILAACIYITCRQSKKPITLLDIAEQIQLNVFKLGKEFKNVLETCRLSIEVMEPEILVEKFISEGLYSDPPLFEKNTATSSSESTSPSSSSSFSSTMTTAAFSNGSSSGGSGSNGVTGDSSASSYNDSYYYSDYLNDEDEYMYQETYDGEGYNYNNGNGDDGGGNYHYHHHHNHHHHHHHHGSGGGNEIMTDIQMHELMSVTVRLVRLASKEWINTGRKPQAIVGAAIKICAEAMGFKVRFDQLAKKTASGQVALRDRHREMLALLTTLSSSLPWAKNLNQKMIQKQLPFLLQYCEALRELHRAKIDFSIKNEDVKEEEQEVIVLSDSDDDDDDDDAVAVVGATKTKTTAGTTQNGVSFKLTSPAVSSSSSTSSTSQQQQQPHSTTTTTNSHQPNFVIPEDYLIKSSNPKTRTESLNEINKLVFSGSEAMPHSFVKSQIEIQRRRMKIRQARSRLSQVFASGTKKEEEEEDTSPSAGTGQCGQQPTSDNHDQNVFANDASTTAIMTTVASTSTTTMTTTVDDHKSITPLQSPVSTTRKRPLDTEDMEIQKLLLEGADEQALEAGDFLLRLGNSNTAIPISSLISQNSEQVTEQDMDDEEASTYLRTQDEVEVYQMLYRTLGDDIDGETTVARLKKRRKMQKMQAE